MPKSIWILIIATAINITGAFVSMAAKCCHYDASSWTNVNRLRVCVNDQCRRWRDWEFNRWTFI